MVLNQETTALKQTAKEELVKFLQIAVEAESKVVMFSDYIDEVWHTLIEDANSYDTFSRNACGRVVKHIASHIPGASGYGSIQWIAEYEERFGKLPKVWFIDGNGQLNEELYNAYLKTGEVVASWSCTPA